MHSPLISSSMAPSLLHLLSFFLLLLLLLLLLFCSSTSSNSIPKQYVVYMGSSTEDQSESQHLQMLSSVIPSDESGRVSLIHHYNHAFKGFSALLTETEASVLSAKDGVASVFQDQMLKLHTTRSWDFLDSSESVMKARHWYDHHHQGLSDVIIGVIDTGIWPESPSFNDHGIGEIPSRWKGICMEGSSFKKSNCNRKLIGARYYDMVTDNTSQHSNKTKPAGSPRDTTGHGTHTASVAAGAHVANASYHGLARGTARGGSPSSRLAIYKACTTDGCPGSTILKAIEDAIKDGVDIISISIGLSSGSKSDYLNDPIAIGAFHAQEKGVLVVCSAGNDGPDPSSIVNTAPWIFTVAASNIDRDFQSTVILGTGKSFQGSAINFSNRKSKRTYPLAFGEHAAATSTPVQDARKCFPSSIDKKKVKGKIVVCIDDTSLSRRIKKLVVEDAGAKGMILINQEPKGVPFGSGSFPFSEVGPNAGIQIRRYINSTKNPTATILPAAEIKQFRPAPSVAYFSSRGPGAFTENILKPDVMAPGVSVLAAMIPDSEAGEPLGYALRSGTSMACPHVSGAAAFIKSVHRGWTSSMIKSALMTTASINNNMGKPLTNSSNQLANPHEFGVGEIDPIRALNPGLVFETTTEDYLQFLCHYGYSEKNIRSMSKVNSFKCPKVRVEEFISNINYPSISISKLDRPRIMKRSVTNVGSTNATYIASVHAPAGLVVEVLPKKIIFSKELTRASFEVVFSGKEAHKGYNFGYVTWVDGRHSVRMWFAVNVE